MFERNFLADKIRQSYFWRSDKTNFDGMAYSHFKFWQSDQNISGYFV